MAADADAESGDRERAAREAAGRLRAGPRVPPEEAILGCRNVTKTFGAVTAVDDVSMGVEAGEWVAIVGPNGAGKTSLLNALNGFYEPDPGGQVFLKGEEVTDLAEHKRARRGLGRTFQGLELFESEDVLENIKTTRAVHERPNLLEAMLYLGPGRRKESRSTRRVEEIIRAVENGEMTVGEGKEALAEARGLIEEMQSEFDGGDDGGDEEGDEEDDGDGQSQKD